MIKYATIGRGTIAETFIEGARLTGRFSLEAVYSRNAETGREFAEKYGDQYTALFDKCHYGNTAVGAGICHKQCPVRQYEQYTQ